MSKLLNEDKIKVPFMRSLSQSLNAFLQKGYTVNFKATEKDTLQAVETSREYRSEDLKLVNFYRFEGISDPADSTILYLIETRDGDKGTLVDAYGAYADPNISKFMSRVTAEELKP